MKVSLGSNEIRPYYTRVMAESQTQLSHAHCTIWCGTAQGIYNCPWLTWIVDMAYFQLNQRQVLDASLSVFQMTFDSARSNRMEGNDDDGGVVLTFS